MAGKYYTGTGDKGDTGLLANYRVSKGDVLIEAIGNIDELNSYIGIAIFHIRNDQLRAMLKHVQNELFIIGANLASGDSKKIEKVIIDDKAIVRLEENIEKLSAPMPHLKQFVMPGGCDGAVHLHFARALARRAERRIVSVSERYDLDKGVIAYVNRLSSFLFVAALYLNYTEGIEEEHPTY
jgi:cob(I)alamin adenosyltransferase